MHMKKAKTIMGASKYSHVKFGVLATMWQETVRARGRSLFFGKAKLQKGFPVSFPLFEAYSTRACLYKSAIRKLYARSKK